MSVKEAYNTKSTVGLKNVVIAELLADDENGVTYGDVQKLKGAVEATITPNNSDPDVQYADDNEFSAIYPDPDMTFTLGMADLPLAIQSKLHGSVLDDNGVLVKGANDQPIYCAVGFKSEKTDGTYRYCWLFKCRANPITEKYQTKEGTTITRQTGEVEFKAIKRNYDGKWEVVADEGENGFNAARALTFLDSVYTPAITAANLQAISIGSCVLSPTFSASVIGYTTTTSQTADEVSATAARQAATVTCTVNGVEQELGETVTWDAGDNTVVFHVVNGTVTKDYTVIVTKS